MSETKEKLIPTNGERPEGLKDDDLVWVQFKDGALDCRRAKSCFWGKHYTDCGWRIPLSNPLVAYCKAEVPEPYVPKPDYSKWIGCLCWVWDGKEETAWLRPLDRYDTERGMPFRAGNSNWSHARPLTPDEVRVYLKKAEEAHAT